MRYSLLAGGKRIRPVLALASAAAIGIAPVSVLPLAAAIRADPHLLPDPRRSSRDGRRRHDAGVRPATSSGSRSEDVAILAGDGLFAEAVRLFCEQPGDPARVLAALRELAAATGVDGMVGGQYLDVAGDGAELTPTACAPCTR